MAKELAHFKNFAKLKDTSVEFNDITVLAGKPGTGKSYVMKMMYAIQKAFDLTKIEYLKSIREANNDILKYIEFSKDFDKPLTDIETAYKLKLRLEEFRKNGLELYEEFNNSIFEERITQLRKNYLKNLIESMFRHSDQISSSFNIQLQNSNISYKKSILERFTLSLNIKHKEQPTIYHDFSKFEDQFKQEPIFVETPLILEFKSFMHREKGKTPYHIESLLNILDTDYSFTDEEQDKFIKSFREKSKSIIGGDIESSGDSFIFNRIDDKNYDILNASSGIKSIGLLQYLVTNKALKKGSVLFWEEPEVHLHPEWQLRMVELFVELMNAGVKIVFSTHSPYMCDYLNAISQKNGFDDRVSFNLFDETDGVVENHILNDENWNKIQAELLDPLEEIMWEYI